MIKHLITIKWKLISVLLIFIFSLIIRLEFAQSTKVNIPVRADAAEYTYAAFNLKFNGIYSTVLAKDNKLPTPNASRPPFYPLLLSLLMTTADNFDGVEPNIRLAQAFIGSLTVLLVTWICIHYLSILHGIIAGLIVATTPHLIIFEGYIITETLYTLELLLAIIGILFVWKLKKHIPALLIGCLLGLIPLTRSAALLLPPFLIIGVFLVQYRITKKTDGLRISLLMLAGCTLIFSLFLLRNTVSIGKPFPESSRGYYSVLQGTYINMTYPDSGAYGGPERHDPLFETMLSDKNFATQVIKERFKQNPIKYFNWYLWGKIIEANKWSILNEGASDIYLYPVITSPFDNQTFFKIISLINKYLHWPIVILAYVYIVILVGCLYKKQKADDIFNISTLLVLTVTYHIMQSIVFYPVSRYTVPLRPEYVIMALAAVHFIYGHLRNMKKLSFVFRTSGLQDVNCTPQKLQ